MTDVGKLNVKHWWSLGFKINSTDANATNGKSVKDGVSVSPRSQLEKRVKNRTATHNHVTLDISTGHVNKDVAVLDQDDNIVFASE